MSNSNEYNFKKQGTHIDERGRWTLGITRDEYALCEYIGFRIQDPRSNNPGWCIDPKEEIAGFVGISRQGLYKMIDKLIFLDLLEVNAETSFIRVTANWVDVIGDGKRKRGCRVNKVDKYEKSECKQSLQDTVNLVYTDCKLSLHNTVNLVTSNIEVKNDYKIDDVDNKDRGAQGAAPNGADDQKNDQVVDLTHVYATYEISTPGGAAPTKKQAKAYDFNDVIEQLSDIEKHFLRSILPEWTLWLENKKVQHKFTYKLSSSHAAAICELINMSGRNIETAKKIIQQSIAAGWKGLFPLKAQASVKPSAQKPFELIDNPHLRGVYPPGHPKHVPNQ